MGYFFKNESFIAISNHSNRLDWFFLWCFFVRYGNLKQERIVVKKNLKNFFYLGFSWGMHYLGYIFLERDLPKDKETMLKTFSHYRETKFPIQLFLFPEGTNLTPNTRLKDTQWALSKQKTTFKNLLCPKVGAFASAVTNLRQVKSIIDITIRYSDTKAPITELSLITCDLPQEIYISFERIPIEKMDLPEEEFLTRQWRKKDDALQNFDKSHFKDSFGIETIYIVFVIFFWLCIVYSMLATVQILPFWVTISYTCFQIIFYWIICKSNLTFVDCF